jgi:APA family basic amino acid/polyamine antiporter
MAAEESIASKAEEPGLLRALGPGMATALVIGNVIGSGIFAKPGPAVEDAGSVPLALAAWVVGGVLCLLGALTIAELALRMPSAGGLYLYLREAFGRPVGFLFGWTEFVFSMPASIGALACFSADQFGVLAGRPLTNWEVAGAAQLLIIALSGINVAGVLWGGRAQFATTLVKCLFLGAMALLPFVLELGGADVVDSSRYGEVSSAANERSLPVRFALALLAVLWAYNGWHVIAPIAEEVRDPKRNIPLSLIAGSVFLIGIYFIAVLAYHGTLATESVIEAGHRSALHQAMIDTLLAPYGSHAVRWAGLVITFAVFCSATGSLNASVMSGPRVGFAMARDGLFPPTLASVHVKYRTPATAIVVQGLMSMLLVLASATLIHFFEYFRRNSIFDLLSNYVVFSASAFLLLAVAAIFPIRRRGGPSPGYVTPCYPWVPLIYIVASALFLAYIFIGKPVEAVGSILLSLSGLPLYWWMARRIEDRG